jgi:hypothetical protein
VEDYFVRRFGGGREIWIKDGTKTRLKDGGYLRSTPFWSAVRQRAIELLRQEARPGIDYALTEIVRCKSKSEFGVTEAVKECVPRYFEKTLMLSSAKVIVVLGLHAQRVVQKELHLSVGASIYGPAHIYGRRRVLAFLPHPNSRGPRTFGKCLSVAELAELRAFLKSGKIAAWQSGNPTSLI